MKYTIGKAVLPFAMIAGLGMSQAQAADLGGDCCADLEERIAELEATAVRKGNRKVSVKLSGQVNTGILYWDDGVDNDVYVVDNTSSSSRFVISGSAKIAAGLTAGFHQEFEYTAGATSLAVSQVDDDGGQNGDGRIDIRKMYWWIKSDQLGKISVGQASAATDDLSLIELGGTGVISTDTSLVGGGIALTQGNISAQRSLPNRVLNSGVSVARDRGSSGMGAIFTGMDSTSRSNIVRYDTPTLMGFTVSTAWGEDDIWDVALRYAGEFNGLRVAAGVGYFETNDDTTGRVATALNDRTDTRFLGSVSVWHVPTGIFLTGNWNLGDDDPALGTLDQDTERYGGRAGWRGKLTPLGDTSFFVGYSHASVDNTVIRLNDREVDDNLVQPDDLNVEGLNRFTGDQEGEMWEVGVVQRVDAAAMELYLTYKHLDFDVRSKAQNVKANVNDQHFVFGGGRIKF